MRFALFIMVLVGTAFGLMVPPGSPRASAVSAVTPAPPPLSSGGRSSSPIRVEEPMGEARETVLERAPGGHFLAVADVNGMPLRFVVDTGADTVALTEADARQANVKFDPSQYEVIGRGASGDVRGQEVLIDSLVLDGKRATIHWENQDAFLEEFDEVTLTKSIFIIDGNRMTTAGGTASIDLMLSLIAADHGEKLANAVADQQIYSSIRTDQDTQRLSVPTRIGVRHPKLSQVIQAMEANIEEPISPSILAREVGMSTRQLERLFRRYLNRSPKRYYMELRLQKARNLLMQTDMTVINVALACGFASPSHFSKGHERR